MKQTARTLILLLAMVPVPAAGLTISDDTFLEADWSALEIVDSSGAAIFTTSQQLAGGNPESFRQTTHSIPGAGQSIIVGHVFSDGHYDPSAEGEIEFIDFALDLRFIGGSAGTAQVGYQLLLVQAGSYYNATVTAGAVAQGPGEGVPGAWSRHLFAFLDASSFAKVLGDGPDDPDFSSSGADIQFGYMTQNSSLETPIATTSGIDNWSVTIVPAPSASALVGLTLLSLAAVRRRLA
jgi:hypothetical protein